MDEPAAGRLRVLDGGDLEEATALLDHSRIENLFLSSRIETAGLDPYLLGCEVLGNVRDGRLVALCHVGSNLVPAEADADALGLFVERLGPRRRVSSVMGDAKQVLPLWEGLSRRWGSSWSTVREVRRSQPLMVLEREPQIDVDPRVRRITLDEFGPYFDAAVKMYTEEVGVSPLEPSGSYAAHVRRTISQGRAFGIVEGGRVVYKSDVGCAAGDACQVQGVWLDPALRGRGLSEPAMAQVARLCQERWPVVSLYVNDYNTRARKLYERIGFDTVGEFATVLY
ncbi:MAG TPA: GNAT family N-acetyltransferase [Candidatus Luteococcus avicola]|nr:GNAT family N-acetyltransferase [Candidatus Luteococcus avicola]